MAAFKFKFKSVQNVKKNLEKKVQKELALIELKIDSLKEVQNNLRIDLKNHRLSARGNKKMSEIQFVKSYAIYIERKIESIEQKIDDLEKEKKMKLADLLQKSKEHKMFDKLEEKHLEKFTKDQNKSDMKNIDEIAIQKFARVKR